MFIIIIIVILLSEIRYVKSRKFPTKVFMATFFEFTHIKRQLAVGRGLHIPVFESLYELLALPVSPEIRT